jgi:hypothetical protein
MPPRCGRAVLAAILAGLCGCGGDPHGGADAASLVARGLEDIERFDFAQGRERFAAARARSEPGGADWRRATYGQAVCAHHKTPPEPRLVAEAEALYRELAGRGGSSREAAAAHLGLARLAELRDFEGDPEDLPAAREQYRLVLAGWGGDPLAGEAALRLAATLLQTLDGPQVREGCRILEERLAAHPRDPLAACMWLCLGDAWHQQLGDPRRAVECLVRADEAGLPANGSEWTTWWRIARLAEDPPVGDRGLAARYYRRLVEEAPTSGKAWEAQQRLRGLGVEPPPIRLLRSATGVSP